MVGLPSERMWPMSPVTRDRATSRCLASRSGPASQGMAPWPKFTPARLWLAFLFGLAATSPVAAGGSPPKRSREVVVLLHGMGRSAWSMSRLACSLERDGYEVLNLWYPSRSMALPAIARDWLPQRLASTAAAPRIHFVTHSMGGILVRAWLRECGAPANLGRVVMLAPPNAGSELSDRLHGFAPARWWTGVNLGLLRTGADSLPQQLGAWPAGTSELGIIAGRTSLNPFFGASLPKPHDGKVSVASTHLAGETDHLVVPFSHTWLAWRDHTHRQVKAFLQRGRFDR